MDESALARRAAAEFAGTAFLTLGIIGSGIAASRLSNGDEGFTLVVNAVATGLVLVAIILAIGSVSGGHLNPAITLVAWMTSGLSRSEAGVYALAQLGGAVLGAIVANLIFGLATLDISDHARSGWELGRPRSWPRSALSW
jgi:glycerol uptake facilitator-like aquaporin